jgi:hypothetical protein
LLNFSIVRFQDFVAVKATRGAGKGVNELLLPATLILRDGSCIAKLANAKENSEFRRRGRGAHAAMEGGTRNWIAIERCIYRHAETGQVRNDGGWEGPLSGVRGSTLDS